MTHVMQFTCSGWPTTVATELKSYYMMPRAHCGGPVFALGNSGGGSSEAASAALARLTPRPWRSGEDEVS